MTQPINFSYFVTKIEEDNREPPLLDSDFFDLDFEVRDLSQGSGQKELGSYACDSDNCHTKLSFCSLCNCID